MPKRPQPKKTSSQGPIEPREFRVEIPSHPPELADERMARVFAVYEAERQGMRLDVPFSVDVNNWPSGGSRVYTFSQDNNVQGNPVINEQIKKWAQQTFASVWVGTRLYEQEYQNRPTPARITDWPRRMPEKKKIDKASRFVKIATEDETKPLRRITL